MSRFVSCSLVVWVLVGCGPSDAGPPDTAGTDAYYALFFERVVRAGEGWWGYPPPRSYCVAISPGGTGPGLERASDPSRSLLESMNAGDSLRSYVPYSRCDPSDPIAGADGRPAGLLWVEPLEETDRRQLVGGWYTPRDRTEWRCLFAEAGGAVRLERCELLSET